LSPRRAVRRTFPEVCPRSQLVYVRRNVGVADDFGLVVVFFEYDNDVAAKREGCRPVAQRYSHARPTAGKTKLRHRADNFA